MRRLPVRHWVAVLAGLFLVTGCGAAAVGAASPVVSLHAGDSVTVKCDGSRGLTDSGNSSSRTISCRGTAPASTSPAPSSTTPTSPTSTPTVTPTDTTTPPPAGFPDASNTGYKHASCPNGLTKFTGSIVSGGSYSCMDFPGGIFIGSNTKAVTNVTFYGDWFHGASPEQALVALFGTGIKFSYCTWAGGTDSSFSQSYQYGISADGSYGSHVGALTVDHSDFSDFGNAIDTAGSTQAAPQIFTANWFHDAQTGGDYHVDGIGTESGSGSGSYVQIVGNTILSKGNTNGIAFQAGKYDHFTVTGNLLGGFGYTVAIWAGSTAIDFENNTYAGGAIYGPLYSSDFARAAGSVWAGNKNADGSVWNP